VHELGNVAQDEAKNYCTHLKEPSRLLSAFSQYKAMENRRCIITVLRFIHCAKMKKGQREINISLVSMIYMK